VKSIKPILLGFILFGLLMPLSAQTKKDETKLAKEALSFYNAQQMADAFPLYSQLIALSPSNVDYTFHFGVCAMYCDADKSNAVKYLKQSIKGGYSSPEVYYYLGRALHLGYQFSEACNAYETFLDTAEPELIEKYNALRQIQMCIYGSKLLANPKEMVVKKKIEAERINFFRYLPLEAVGGKIITTPTDFLGSKDRKSTEPHLIHINGTPKLVYFSILSDTSGLDIFQAELKPDGSYGKPTLVAGKVNTPYDEDYPFIHPDGKHLYFASKGHNSMGGYDIFRSDLDSLSKRWKKPVNLGFSFNTPDDDLMFIADAANQTAIFATARTSDISHYTLYQTSFQGSPLEIIYAKGHFTNMEHPDNNVAQIVVKDLETGEIVSEVTAEVKSGAFDVYFPKPGRYSYTVTLPDSEEKLVSEFDVQPGRSGAVYFPQTVNAVKKEDGAGQLVVRNGADTNLDSGMENSLAALLRAKSNMSVSKEAAEMASLERSMTNAPALAGFAKGKTADDILAEMKSEAKAASAAIPVVQQQKQAAFQLAKQQMNQANAKMILSDSLAKIISAKVESAKAKGSPYIFTDQDREILNQSTELREAAEAHRLKAQGALNLGNQLAEYQSSLEPTSKELLSRATKLQSYLKDNNVDGAVEVLTEERKRLLAEQARPKKPANAMPQKAKAAAKSHEANQKSYNDLVHELNVLEAKVLEDKKNNSPSLAQTQAAAKNKRSEVILADPKVKKTYDEAVGAQMANKVYNQMTNQEDLGLSEAEKTPLSKEEIAQLQGQMKTLEAKSNEPYKHTLLFDQAKVSWTRNYNLEEVPQPGNSPDVKGPVIAATNTDVAQNNTPADAQPKSTNVNTENQPEVTPKVENTTTSASQSTDTNPKNGNLTSSNKTNPGGDKKGPFTPQPSDNEDVSLALKSAKVIKEVIDSANFKEYDANYAMEEHKVYDLMKKYPDISGSFKERARMDSLNKAILENISLIDKASNPNDEKILQKKYNSLTNRRAALEVENKEVYRSIAMKEVEAEKSVALKKYYDNESKIKSETILNQFIQQIRHDADSISNLAVNERKKAETITDPLQKDQLIRSAFAKDMMVASMYRHMNKAIDALPIFELYNTQDEAFLLSSDPNAIRAKFSTHKVEAGAIAENKEKTETETETETNTPPAPSEKIDADLAAQLSGMQFDEEKMKKNGIVLQSASYSKEDALDLMRTKPERVDKPFFVRINKSAYGAQNPIPVDEPMPEGIVYSVQVGAFKKPIPQNTFNDFAPVMGQKLNNGFTRYMAGLFPDKKDAMNARNEIRKMGYPDAFVVVYKDGKRISVDAAEKAKEDEPKTPVVKNETPKATSNIPLKANKIEEDENGYFTIQVGVFGRPALEGEINLPNLNVEYVANKNLYRYSTGQYMKRSEAQAQLAKIKSLGYEDAFVTAYFKGKKIGLTEAENKKFTPSNNPTPASPAANNPKATAPAAPKAEEQSTTEQTPKATNKVENTPKSDTSDVKIRRPELNMEPKENVTKTNPKAPIQEEPGKIYEFDLSDLYGTYTCCEEAQGICNSPDNRDVVKRLTLISNGSGVAIDGNNKTKNFKWKFVKDSPNPIQGMEDILGADYPFYFSDGKVHLGQYCKPLDK
jgi:hypothetical protein